jgi:hypothetical protein
MGAEWAVEEMRYLHLSDNRLSARTQRVIGALSERPAQSVPEASGNWAATKAVYRLWSNPRVEEVAIRKAHYQATRDRVAGERRILAIQDTTELNYTGKNVAEVLGHLANEHTRGLLMHSTLAVSELGVPLGLVHQQIWTRDLTQKGQVKERRKKETSEKESQRWLDSLQATEAILPETVEIVHIADREGDIYDLFALPRREGSHLLIRVDHNRRVEHEARYLWEAIHQAPVVGERTVWVKPQANREARLAQVSVRFTSLTIRPPHKQPGAGVSLQIILAEEREVPSGVEPIVWLLATTLPVASFQEALVGIDYYALRWLIERYHFVLKSGCQVEELYLQTPDRLLRALAIYAVVAWRVLWLTYEARQTPDQPCDRVLKTHEWQALYCTIHKTATPPATPPTLRQAVFWIARLGGFLGRKGDGDPGPKTIWRGLRRLDDIAATWLLLHSYPYSTYG